MFLAANQKTQSAGPLITDRSVMFKINLNSGMRFCLKRPLYITLRLFYGP